MDSDKKSLARTMRLLYTTQIFNAGVAELVDAPDLGSGAFGVGVRVPSPAPLSTKMKIVDFVGVAGLEVSATATILLRMVGKV